MSFDRFEAAGLPRLVVFDVDGTLQDTAAWWPELAARGLRLFGERTGHSIPAPSAEHACALVGLDDRGVWTGLLPAALHERWRELRDLTLPLEQEVLRAGKDYLFPGTRALLEALRAEGVFVALASNCRQPYLDSVLADQGVGPLVDAAYCLDSTGADSTGASHKSEMVAAAIAAAGTRDGAVVGDRALDREAARAHALPFVLRLGHHAAGELDCAGEAASQAEVGALLGARGRFLREFAERLAGARRVAVTGPVGVGKSCFAPRLAAALGLELLRLDDWAREVVPPEGPVADPPARAFELARFGAELAKREAFVAEGLFLEDVRLRPRFERVVHLVARREDLEARVLARGGSAALARLTERYLPAWRRFSAHAREDPGRICVDARNALLPRVVPRLEAL